MLLAALIGDLGDVERLAAPGLLLDGADRPALGLLIDGLLHRLSQLVERHRLALVIGVLALRVFLCGRGARGQENSRERDGHSQQPGCGAPATPAWIPPVARPDRA